MSARAIAICSLLALLTACDKASLPASALAATHAVTVAPVPTASAPLEHQAAERELQAKCAEEARDWYTHEYAWAQAPNSGGVRFTSRFTSHFSAELGRCFVLVDSSTEKTDVSSNEVARLQTSTLTDVAANRHLGTAAWFGSNDAFNQCQVSGTACFSEQEWRVLLRPYMEN